MSRSLARAGVMVASLLAVCAIPAWVRADPPKVLEFRTQVVNNKTYFHLRLEAPADMAVQDFGRNRRFDFWDMQATPPALQARLVPQDDAARLVYGRERFEDRFGRPPFDEKEVFPPKADVKIEEKKEFKEKDKDFDKKKDFDEEKKEPQDKDGNPGANNVLEFFGVLTGKQEAAFLLIYPKAEDETPKGSKIRKGIGKLLGIKKQPSLFELLREKNNWAEVTIKLDPAKATKVAAPKDRDGKIMAPRANDLEGLWAFAQAMHFAQLEGQTPEFGFYSFAREATSRLYKVPSPQPPWQPWMGERFGGGGPGGNTRRLYEVTTGAAAITESLALERMRNRRPSDKEEPRTIAIGTVPGIDIAEHPWKKMMGDKKPAPEPLANLVPHDNYYLHFKTITKFLEAGDLLDQWGTTLTRAFEVNSHDYHLKQKLEQQICLKSTGLARIFGPAVIKSLAITGNDPYLREGSDFSMIFELSNKSLFKVGTEPTLDEARKKFGKLLSEDKAEYQGVVIESFVTPLREVSLHRAMFADYAVYSNSAVAVRRIIDCQQGKIKRLADALDFQYMRTVFRLDDPEEDGFVFLSDAFIRNLVGPVVRIKERRRLEALTSMHMLTNGAMFTAWQTGKLPENQQQILSATGLEPQELLSPDGTVVNWNGAQNVAVSSVYNTLHFATPLIEMPIDRVTQSEAREYEMFRAQYLGLWRQFFDPIGIRLSLKNDQAKMEVYILPLVNTSQYNELRRMTGDGTIKIDASMFSDKTLVQYLMHASPQLFNQNMFRGGPGADLMVDLALRSWLGDWFTVKFDDSPVYGKLLESYIRSQMFPEERHDFVQDLQLLYQMPVTVGFDVRSTMMFAGLLTGVRKAVETTLPGAIEWGPMKEPYKGVPIVRIKASSERIANLSGLRTTRDPSIYYAMVDGAFYASLQEDPIHDVIDRSIALKDSKKGIALADVNTTLHLGPKAAVKAKDLLRLYLEWEMHRRAQLNNRLLYALFKSNVVGPQDDSKAVEAGALQYLGFIPVSPDLAPFHYEWKKEEVVNRRHGSLRQPTLQPGVDADSPLGQVLEEFAAIRADLRFREDGVHTTVTLRKNVK